VPYRGSPARFSESDFEFLDRVAGAHWDRVRALLEQWFTDHPAQAKRDLYNRFMDPDNGQHMGAWWELYIASLFRHLGYDVLPHPTIEGSKRKPDFLVTRKPAAFYVECTVAGAGGTRGTAEWIYDCISDVETRDFLVGIDQIERGAEKPKRVEVTRPIAQWLAGLDPDELLSAPHERLPHKVIRIRDWSIEFIAYPNRPDARHKGGRLIGTLPPVFDFPANTVDRIHEAISKKGRRYGSDPLPLPLVVAVLEGPGWVDEDEVGDALFGRKEWQWYAGHPESIHQVRKRNGYWRGDWSADDVQRGTRVSAALFASNLRYWRIATHLPELWINPWAAVPLNHHDDFTTTVARDNGEISRAEGTLAAVANVGVDADDVGRTDQGLDPDDVGRAGAGRNSDNARRGGAGYGW
jgi:hypothetical protein